MTSDFQINQIADREFGRVNNPPVNYYIALLLTMPNPDGTGAVEVSSAGTGYARQVLPNNKTALTQAVNGKVTNASPLNFPAAIVSWWADTATCRMALLLLSSI